MIHETGLYVFEIKHYKGTIYGKDTDEKWTQYFRTVKNNCFKNPILQNKYHIDNLKLLFPDLPIFSMIVFTSSECELKVSNSSLDANICKLNNIGPLLFSRFKNQEALLSADKIDEIFTNLSKYSQMQDSVEINEEIKPFYSWVQPTIDKIGEKHKELAVEKERLEKCISDSKKAKKGISFSASLSPVSV